MRHDAVHYGILRHSATCCAWERATPQRNASGVTEPLAEEIRLIHLLKLDWFDL